MHSTSPAPLRVLILGDDDGYSAEVIRQGGTPVALGARDATAVVFGFDARVPDLAQALAENPEVRWVQLHSAGIERFATLLKERPDLTWTSAKGAYALPVAEHALALTLALLRELPTRARATSWSEKTGTSLHGLRVTVVGAGGVALEIVRLMKAFDTEVTVIRRLDEPVEMADHTASDLDSVLQATDVLVLAAAHTPSTHHMVGAAQLDALPDHAIIVNIARGALIDTDALVDALSAGRIQGAALDVTDPEPLPDGHPLWSEPRCLITPHAADTIEMIQPLYRARIAANLAAFRGVGPFVGLVDPVAGY